MFRLIKRAPWIALGAAVAYYVDPASGITRRRRLRRQVEELWGDASDRGPTFSPNGTAPDGPRGSDGVERRRSEDTVDPLPDAVPLDDPHA